MAKPRPEDIEPDKWRRIRLLYEAGVLSVTRIAEKTRVTRGQIQRVAARQCWVREETSDTEVMSGAVGEAETAVATIIASDVDLTPDQNQVRLAGASIWAMLSEHRQDIDQAKQIETRLTTRLLVDAQEERLPLNTAINSYARLVDSMSKRIGLERQIFGLRDGDAAPEEKQGPVALTDDVIEQRLAEAVKAMDNIHQQKEKSPG